MEEPLAKALFDEFEKETGIKVEWVRLSGGEAVARLEAEQANPQASIWVGGVGTQHIEAQLKGLTTPYRSRMADNIPEKYRDPENYWTGLYIGPIAFCMNTKRAEELKLEMPRSWADLVKPEYERKVRVAHPSTSGTAYNVVTTVIRVFDGDEDKAFDYLKKLNNSVEQYTRSGSAPGKSCAIGEIPIAIGYLHDQVKLRNEGAPLEIAVPSDGTGFETASMSLVKGGPDALNAKKLYDWVLGGKAMDIIAKWYVIPLSSLARPTETGFALAEMKLVDQDDRWDASNKERLVDRWNKEITSEYSK
ncbi:MAG: ABC transporter substrate-binding protein [Fretibacterium sp.]|nr:ABC transporter substrate-binding protein [Fretibacterium sp.]